MLGFESEGWWSSNASLESSLLIRKYYEEKVRLKPC